MTRARSGARSDWVGMADLPPPRGWPPAPAWEPPPPGWAPPPGARPSPGAGGTTVWVLPPPVRSVPPLEVEARRVVRIELLVMLFVTAVPNLVFGLSGISRPRSVRTD